MFAPFCERHGARVLLTTHEITGMTRTPLGWEVAYRCYCGSEGTALLGRPALAVAATA